MASITAVDVGLVAVVVLVDRAAEPPQVTARPPPLRLPVGERRVGLRPLRAHCCTM